MPVTDAAPAPDDREAWRALLDDAARFDAARRALPAEARVDLGGLDLRGRDLRVVDLSGCDLTGADLSGARVREAALVTCRLEGTRLDEVRAEGSVGLTEGLRRLWTSAEAWNAWRAEERFPPSLWRCDLARASLAGFDLSGVLFHRSLLDHVDFRGARLGDNVFQDARLRGADFRDLALERCDFERADVRGATFDGARLRFVRFPRARAAGASFVGARLADTSAIGADLRGADLEGLVADGLDVGLAQLGCARLRGARVDRFAAEETDFTGCDLADAVLDGDRSADAGGRPPPVPPLGSWAPFGLYRSRWIPTLEDLVRALRDDARTGDWIELNPGADAPSLYWLSDLMAEHPERAPAICTALLELAREDDVGARAVSAFLAHRPPPALLGLAEWLSGALPAGPARDALAERLPTLRSAWERAPRPLVVVLPTPSPAAAWLEDERALDQLVRETVAAEIPRRGGDHPLDWLPPLAARAPWVAEALPPILARLARGTPAQALAARAAADALPRALLPRNAWRPPTGPTAAQEQTPGRDGPTAGSARGTTPR